MKLAIVIPWFGRDLKCGAEQQAWQIASRLAARGHEVEVVTTCCRSHQDDWATNHLPPGVSTEPEGFTIRRFGVAPRDRAAFDHVCAPLMNFDTSKLLPGVSPVRSEDAATFANELIKSPELLAFLRAHSTGFDWFLFLPYLYGPILHGISLVGDRAVLQPCLHDEAYAYLPPVADAFHLAAKLLFNSDGEMELALRLFGPGIWGKSVVVGEGVESESDHARNGRDELADVSTSHGRYVLYLGRKEEGKNTPLLVRAFARFKATRPNSDLKLLLAGHGVANVTDGVEGIIDLGVMDHDGKERLLRDCSALFQPSQKESFSRVMMEGWMHRKPVAAHASCLATAVAVQRSGGGWLAATEEEWASLFAIVARADDDQLSQLGNRGQAYARSLADWDAVMQRYESALPEKTVEHLSRPVRKAEASSGAINQFLPNLSYGDAISNYAIWIRDQIRARGWVSEIYPMHVDPRLEHECSRFSEEHLRRSRAAIYHHSIGSEITSSLLAYNGPKCVIYHNITPADFLEPYRPEFAQILRHGRDELSALAKQFDLAFGVSKYNAEELRERGFKRPDVLPISVDPQKWNFPPDPTLMAALQDGKTNILFVGRIAPNKKQDHLIAVFKDYLSFDPTARLILVGKAEENDPYASHVQELIIRLGLQDSVVTPGIITDAQLAACYRTARLFWSMSEHEGFCVPLIEAMWFDVPVFAYRSSAVSETLDAAGLLFTTKQNSAEVAAAAHLLIQPGNIRDAVIKQQRRRRETYLPENVQPALEQLLDALTRMSDANSRGRVMDSAEDPLLV